MYSEVENKLAPLMLNTTGGHLACVCVYVCQKKKIMDAATLQHNINLLFRLKKLKFRLKHFDEDYADRLFVWSTKYQPEECKRYQKLIDELETTEKNNGQMQGIIAPTTKVCPRPVPKLKVPNDFAHRMKQRTGSYTSTLLVKITGGSQCTTVQRNVWHFIMLKPGSFAAKLKWFLEKHEAAQCAMTTLRAEKGRPCKQENDKDGYLMYLEEVAEDDYERKYVRLCGSCKLASMEFSDQKKTRAHLYEFVNERLTRKRGSPLPPAMADKLIIQDYLHYP